MKALFATLAIALIASVASATIMEEATKPMGPWIPARKSALINMDQTIDMVVALKRNNMEKMDKIFWEVSDPKSANYGEHLKNDEMRHLVGRDELEIEKVKAWLSANGITDVTVGRHADSLKFKAKMGQVEQLLSVKFANYECTKTGRVIPRALGAYSVPDALSNLVEAVIGHRGFPFPKMERIKPIGGPFNQNITPSIIYDTYKETTYPPTPSGEHNIVSFFQAQGQYVSGSDLTAFCQGVMPSGYSGSCEVEKYIGTNSGSEPGIESSLDSQYITASSYGLPLWVYSYTSIDFCSDLASWAQDVFGEKDGKFPYVISMSYGSQALPIMCKSTYERIAKDIQKMGTMGISVVIASGDNGSGEFSRTGWNWGYLGASFPAEIPYATSVGSTTFESGNSGTERSATFSGGGFSFYFEAPEYQKSATANFLSTSTHIPSNPKSFNASGKGTPDVSAFGENFFIIDGGFGQQVSGTSCSTPTFAGMVGRLNNLRLANGKTLGYLNPFIYQNADAFTDITSGTNDMNHDGNGWYAQAGWDAVSGQGTPRFDKLSTAVNNLNARENARKQH